MESNSSSQDVFFDQNTGSWYRREMFQPPPPKMRYTPMADGPFVPMANQPRRMMAAPTPDPNSRQMVQSPLNQSSSPPESPMTGNFNQLPDGSFVPMANQPRRMMAAPMPDPNLRQMVQSPLNQSSSPPESPTTDNFNELADGSFVPMAHATPNDMDTGRSGISQPNLPSFAPQITVTPDMLSDMMSRILDLEGRLGRTETQLQNAHTQISYLTEKLSSYRTARGSPALKPYFDTLPPFNSALLANWSEKTLEFELAVKGTESRSIVIDFPALITRQFLAGKNANEIRKDYAKGILEIIGDDEYIAKLSASDGPRALTKIPPVLIGHAAWCLYLGFGNTAEKVEDAKKDPNFKHYMECVQVGLQDLLINVRRRRRETHASPAE